MIWLIIGLALFLGVHSVRMVAPGYRDQLIAKRGQGVWKGIYSVLAILGFIILVWGYGQARMEAPVLYVPPIWTRHVALLLMWPALIIFLASLLPAGKIKAAVKHPMIVGIKIWAFAHLLANGDLASLLLFGSFLAWSVVNRIACKRRGDPVHDNPVIRSDIIAAISGSLFWIWFVMQGHQLLFGVSPIG
jgi:uncharacterized membrane protein